MKTLALLTPPLRWFLLAMVLANTASVMVFTFLALYLTQLGATVPEVGLAFTLAAIVPVGLQVLGGWWSDSIGRLRTIAIGAAVATLGYVGILLAPTWEWVIVALAFEYVSGALVGPSYSAYITEQSPEAARGRVFGLMNGLFLIVTVIGPLLGGLLVGRLGYSGMLAAACALYMAAAAIRLWMALTLEPRPTGGRAGRPLDWRDLRRDLRRLAALLLSGGVLTWIFLTDGVRDVSFRLAEDFYPLYYAQIGGLTVDQIGGLRALGGLALMAATFLSGALADRYGERRMIVAGFALMAAGLAVFLQASDLAGFTVAAVVFQLGGGVIIPAYDAFVSKAVPADMRGVTFGVFQSSVGLIALPAPWLGAQLWERTGARTPFALTAVAAGLAAGLVWFKFTLAADEPPQEAAV